jgi:hypothetical protein
VSHDGPDAPVIPSPRADALPPVRATPHRNGSGGVAASGRGRKSVIEETPHAQLYDRHGCRGIDRARRHRPRRDRRSGPGRHGGHHRRQLLQSARLQLRFLEVRAGLLQKNIDVRAYFDVHPNIKGNYADGEAAATAYGKNTFTETLSFADTVEGYMSRSGSHAVAASAPPGYYPKPPYGGYK